jgi:hypothetical protein
LFPLLWSELVTESFRRYVLEVRRPCNKLRDIMIAKVNEKLRFANITPQNIERNPIKAMRRALDDEAKAEQMQ